MAKTTVWLHASSRPSVLTVDIYPATRGGAIAKAVECTPHPERAGLYEIIVDAPFDGILHLIANVDGEPAGYYYAAVRDDDGVYYAVDSIAEAVTLQTLSSSGPLSFSESTILEALGDDTLTAPKLAGVAGYTNNSGFRNKLSQLVKRGILENVPGRGYRRTK